jgi:hypothetical protein
MRSYHGIAWSVRAGTVIAYEPYPVIIRPDIRPRPTLPSGSLCGAQNLNEWFLGPEFKVVDAMVCYIHFAKPRDMILHKVPLLLPLHVVPNLVSGISVWRATKTF